MGETHAVSWLPRTSASSAIREKNAETVGQAQYNLACLAQQKTSKYCQVDTNHTPDSSHSLYFIA